jgi:cyanophycinase-like exopeptidase
MILGKEIPDFRALGMRSIPTFGLIPFAFIMPHFDAIPLFGKPLVSTLRLRLKNGETMIGVDEDTAVIGKLNEEWTVMGKAKAHLFTKDESKSYAAGEKFSLGK